MATTEHRGLRDFLYSWEAKMCGDSRGDRWKEREVDRPGLTPGSVSQDKEFGLHPKSNGELLRDF